MQFSFQRRYSDMNYMQFERKSIRHVKRDDPGGTQRRGGHLGSIQHLARLWYMRRRILCDGLCVPCCALIQHQDKNTQGSLLFVFFYWSLRSFSRMNEEREQQLLYESLLYECTFFLFHVVEWAPSSVHVPNLILKQT